MVTDEIKSLKKELKQLRKKQEELEERNKILEESVIQELNEVDKKIRVEKIDVLIICITSLALFMTVAIDTLLFTKILASTKGTFFMILILILYNVLMLFTIVGMYVFLDDVINKRIETSIIGRFFKILLKSRYKKDETNKKENNSNGRDF